MPNQIASTALIHPNVTLGDNVTIEDFCIIGCPPVGRKPGDLGVVIGDNAVIRSHTVIYAGNRIGSNFHTGHKANLRELNEIGENVSIGTLSVIEHHVKIKDGVRIHTQVFVPEYCILEKSCWLGPNVVLTNAKYPLSEGAKNKLNGVRVGRRVIIGANATILPGVIIGDETIVGAGALVTKDLQSGGVYAGNPARRLKEISSLPCRYHWN